MRYTVTLIQPQGYVHAQGLWDVCRLIHWSLESLGMQSRLQVNHLDTEGMNVVVGYHLMRDPAAFGNARVIFYQLEQIADGAGWFTPQRLPILQRAEEIWDYSAQNIAFLQSRGLTNVKHVPLGFHERMRSIADLPKEIDVLFYGSLNERRKAILDRLASRCKVRHLFGVYGAERDLHIARSKIVLNLHCYSAQIFEQARVSYLINNGRFVVSETPVDDPYQGMVVTAAYEDLPEACVRFLADDAGRERFAAQAFENFRRFPMTEYLKPLLRR
jgi:hypothetical protein